MFTYSITMVNSGTGHGTSAACFINAANGYAPGDNSASDAVACANDWSSWRVDWNVVTGANPMAVTLTAAQTPNPSNAVKIRYQWGGVDGSSSLPYTGSTSTPYNPDVRAASADAWAKVDFKAGQSASGYFTVRGMQPLGLHWNVNNHLLATYTTRLIARADTATATATNDRDLTIVDGSRFDSQLFTRTIDSFSTTINGQPYVGLNSSIGIESGNGCTGTARWPGFGEQGYECHIDPASTGLRASIHQAIPNVYFSIDNGTPVAASYDANGHPYYDTTRLDVSVKVLVPYTPMPAGMNDFLFRMDPTGTVLSRDGQPAFNGQADPGKGLTCNTTTANVYPATAAGRYMPNNNCATFSYNKMVGSGLWAKRDLGPTRTVNGTDYRPTGFPYIQGTWGTGWNNNPITRIQLSPGSLPATHDFSVCDVWEPGKARLGTGDGGAFLPVAATSTSDTSGYAPQTTEAVTKFYPGAVVYYTTQDLRPTAADSAPRCGSPSDGTSGWTTTYPSPEKVSGVMVVFPGQNTLRDDFVVYIPKYGNEPQNYSQLVTTVPNYMGATANGAAVRPTWSIHDESAIQIIKNAAAVGYVDEAVTSPLKVGAQTLSLQAQVGLYVSSADLLKDPDAIITIRVYTDRCLSNITPTSPKTVFVPVPETDTSCGTGLSYLERKLTFNEFLTGWGNGDPMPRIGHSSGQWSRSLTYTATTPQTAKPGDVYINKVVASIPTDDPNYFTEHPRSEGHDRIVMPAAAVVSSTKTTNTPVIHRNQAFTDTVGWYNYTESNLGKAQFIDVLPYNGDRRGTSYTGTRALASVTYTGTAGTDATSIEYTAAAAGSVATDPNATSNGPGGATRWCTGDQFGTPGCPATIGDTTALRFTTTNFAPTMSQFYALRFTTHDNSIGDRYVNSLSLGRVAGLGQPIPAPAPVETVVDDTVLSGNVYNDLNRDSSWDTGTGEPGVDTYTVTLLDAGGNVVATTRTDAAGHYEFISIAPGDYQVKVELTQPWNAITQSYTNPAKGSGLSGTVTVADYQKVSDVDFGLTVLVPAIEITKAGSLDNGAAVADLNDAITYTFTVTNTGELPLTAVTVTDAMLATANTPITCAATDLAVGAHTTCTAHYTATQADIDSGGPIHNEAGVTSTATDVHGDHPVTDDSNPVDIPVAQPNPALTLSKAAAVIEKNATEGTNPGDEIQYTFTLVNNGNVTLDNLVITDPRLPADTTYTCVLQTNHGGGSSGPIAAPMQSGTTTLSNTGGLILAPRQSAVCTASVRYTVTDSDAVAGEVHNTATATATTPQGENVPSNQAETLTPVVGTKAVSLVKAAAITSPADAKAAKVGDTITYTFAVTNTGTTTITDLVINDPMLATAKSGITCVQTTLAAGASTVCSATYTVTAADVDAGTVTNIATAHGNGYDDEPVTSNPSDTTTPTTGPVGLALVKRIKQVIDVNRNGQTDTGDTITYTFAVTNTGQRTVVDVRIDDPMLAKAGELVSCLATTLKPGATTTCQSSPYTITQADVHRKYVLNVATATGSAPDKTPVRSKPAEAYIPMVVPPAPPSPTPPRSTVTTTPTASAPVTTTTTATTGTALPTTKTATATTTKTATATATKTAAAPTRPPQPPTAQPLAHTGSELGGWTLIFGLILTGAGITLTRARRGKVTHRRRH